MHIIAAFVEELHVYQWLSSREIPPNANQATSPHGKCRAGLGGQRSTVSQRSTTDDASLSGFCALVLAHTHIYPVPPSDLSSHLTTRYACRPVLDPPGAARPPSFLVGPCRHALVLTWTTTHNRPTRTPGKQALERSPVRSNLRNSFQKPSTRRMPVRELDRTNRRVMIPVHRHLWDLDPKLMPSRTYLRTNEPTGLWKLSWNLSCYPE